MRASKQVSCRPRRGRAAAARGRGPHRPAAGARGAGRRPDAYPVLRARRAGPPGAAAAQCARRPGGAQPDDALPRRRRAREVRLGGADAGSRRRPRRRRGDHRRGPSALRAAAGRPLGPGPGVPRRPGPRRRRPAGRRAAAARGPGRSPPGAPPHHCGGPVTAMTTVRSSARTTFAALAIPNYRRYIGGQSVSLIGTWMQSVAQSWLVLQLTDSGTALGLVVALQTLPVLLLGPYGGVVADRVDKRRLMIGLQSAMGVLALTLGLLTITGLVALWQVFLLAFLLGPNNCFATPARSALWQAFRLGSLLGLTNCFETPARQSFILEMVGPEHLRNAVSLNSVMVNVARAVGPAVAGVVIAVGGTGICFLLNAASFVAVVVSLATLDRSRLQPSPPAARAPGQLREGLTYVRRTPELAVPLLMMALVGCLAFEFQIVLPVVARQTFSGGSEDYGLITAAMGAGAVVGGLLVAGRGRTGAPAMVRNALLFGGALALAAAAPSLPLELGAIAVVGGMSVAFQSTGNSTLQLTASPSMRGRVMALWAVAFLGSTPIGGPIAGFVSDQLGGRGGLALGALACVVAAGLGALLLRRGPSGASGGEPRRPAASRGCDRAPTLVPSDDTGGGSRT